MTGFPSFVTNPGMIVWYGRLRGPTWFGGLSVATNEWPRVCSEIPVQGTTTPEPKPMKFDWISETIMPRSSAAVR